jgi:hypothetical protein
LKKTTNKDGAPNGRVEEKLQKEQGCNGKQILERRSQKTGEPFESGSPAWLSPANKIAIRSGLETAVGRRHLLN